MTIDIYFRILVNVCINSQDVLKLFSYKDLRTLMFVSKDIRRYTKKLRKLCIVGNIFNRWYNLTKLSGFPSVKNLSYVSPQYVEILSKGECKYIPYIYTTITYDTHLDSLPQKAIYNIHRSSDLLRNIFIDKRYKDYIDRVELMIEGNIINIKLNNKPKKSLKDFEMEIDCNEKMEWYRIPFFVHGSYLPLVSLPFHPVSVNLVSVNLVFFEPLTSKVNKIPLRLDFMFLTIPDRDKLDESKLNWKIQTYNLFIAEGCVTVEF